MYKKNAFNELMIISDTKNFKFKTLNNDNGKILNRSSFII